MTQTAATDQDISAWIVERLAQILGARPGEIGVHDEIAHYGLQSVEAMSLMSELSDRLGLSLSPTLWWDCRTIAQLVERIRSADGGTLAT
ncbi:MAG: acyl carrier protein [Proteobacteria bacterium]|nr:acyl carrier protein [Pseudomonadota bacterium]